MGIEPEWVKTGNTADGISVNKYFIDNPEMLLGTMTNDSGTRMYGNENSTTCLPFEGADLAFIVMPVQSNSCSFIRNTATELSTPPLIAINAFLFIIHPNLYFAYSPSH